jgi:hypothetical protein
LLFSGLFLFWAAAHFHHTYELEQKCLAEGTQMLENC